MSSQTPTALGYRMPAEWEPHTATWLSWPRREGISFPESFDRVLPALRAMVEALIESEQVCINVCNGAHESEARSVLSGLSMERITFYRVPTNEPWCRDHGPIFLTRDRSWSRRALAPLDAPRLEGEPTPSFFACEKNRAVVATPWLVGGDTIKGDPFHGQSAQDRARFCFMRAVANVDADLLGFDQRFDHRTQRRQNAIERFWKTNPLASRPRKPCGRVRFPFGRHAITERGWTL